MPNTYSCKRIKFPIIPTVKILIAITILYLLVKSTQINISLFISLLQKPLLLFEVICLLLVMTLAAGWRWYLLNSAQEINLGFNKTIIATYVGSAFNNVLPGAVAGDIVRLFYVFKEFPQQKGRALLTLFSDRIMGFLAIFITISIVSIINFQFFSQQPHVLHLILICIAFGMCAITGFVFCLWLAKHMQVAAWLHKYFGYKKWCKSIISFFETLSIFQFKKNIIIKSVIISVMTQLLMVCAIMSIANIMGLPQLAFSHYVIAMGVTQVVNLIPITPGGLGIGEMAFANILLLLNPGISAAYATVLFAYRVISIITYMPGAVYYVPRFLYLRYQSANGNGSVGIF